MDVARKPMVLGPNLPAQPLPYVGGGGIARFRGFEPADSPPPEDWIASTVTRFGEGRVGLTGLADGRMLRDAIAADPVAFLGPGHVAELGADPGFLVKLLDAAERLTVHLHPDDAFARRHLACDFGKTEAWIVMETPPSGGEVWVGFNRDVDADEALRWYETADSEAILASLNQIPVVEGSAVLVPAGVPHAIGAGVLVLELQQPTDFSIGVEPFVPTDGTPCADDLGLGMRVALGALDLRAWSAERVGRLLGSVLSGSILPAAADPYFRAESVHGADGPVVLEQGFALLVGLRGSGRLLCEEAGVEVGRGATVLMPYGAGPARLVGDVAAIVCRPGVDPMHRPPRPLI